MPSESPFLIAVTGGPGSGKTTLLSALARLGHATEIEAGRAVILAQRRIDGPAQPGRDPVLFAEQMLALDMRSHDSAVARGGITFLDRGVIDTIGYLRLMDLPVPSHMIRAAGMFRYNTVFIAPPWQAIYTHDSERSQDFAEAVRTHDAMVTAWTGFGYAPIVLPTIPVEGRAAFVLRHLGAPEPTSDLRP